MIENLIDARKSRKRINRLVKKQQLDDSCCAEKLTSLGLDAKRGLLDLLAKWLVSFEPGKQFEEDDRSVFAKIDCHFSLEEWLSLQERESSLSDKLMAARSAEDDAFRIYDRVAPWGDVQIWLKKNQEKAKAEQLQHDYKTKKASRELIEHDLVSVVRVDIQKKIGGFLRAALDPASLELLASQSSVKQELQMLFRELERKALEAWGPHSEEQSSSLREIAREVENLANFYSTASATKAEKLLPQPR